MRTALGRAARAAGSCAHWLGNGGAGTRSSSIGRARARHRRWRWHHSSCTGRAGRAERLCSGRRHFGAIRSSGARTHRHRRVTASRGDIRRCRTLQNAIHMRWLGPGEHARRGRCHRWQQVAHRFERCVWPRVFPRRAEHRERHPSPRLHRPAHILRRRRSDPRKTSHPGKNARLKLPAAKAWVLPAERHGAVRAALERFFQSDATQQGVAFLLWQGAARGRFLPKGAYCENGSSDLNQAERLRLPSITCCKAVMPMR